MRLCVRKRGNRERDLALFATRVLRRVRPGALLLSGDLTDSKTVRALRHVSSSHARALA
jgi:hypothetical protein